MTTTDAPPLPERRCHQSRLFALVEQAYPDCVSPLTNGRMAVSRLAKKIGKSNQTAYRWFFDEQITLKALNLLVEHSEGRLKREELYEFLPKR